MDTVQPSTPSKTLLIVEDDALTAMTLRDALEDAGSVVMDLTGRHQDAIIAARAALAVFMHIGQLHDAGTSVLAIASISAWSGSTATTT